MLKHNLLIALPIAIALAGCAGTSGKNPSLESINQPVVTRTNYAIDLVMDGSGIGPSEEARLVEWFNALNLGYGDRISLDFGNGYGSAAVSQDVATIAGVRGMLLTSTPPVTEGYVQAGEVRIIVTRASAAVPNCPNWKTETELNHNTATSENYGCGTNSNLAAMVADPEDLISGKTDDTRQDGSGNRAVETYRSKRTGDNP